MKDLIVRNDLIKRLSSELSVVESEVIKRFEALKPKKRYIVKDIDSKESSIKHYDSKSDKAQLEILKLLIHNPSLAEKVALSLMDNKLCYNIMKTIKENSGNYNNVAQLLEYIGDSPEERNLVASIAVDVPEKNNEKAILNDCITTLENISIQNEIGKIRNKIKNIENSNQSMDSKLIRQLEELRKKVK